MKRIKGNLIKFRSFYFTSKKIIGKNADCIEDIKWLCIKYEIAKTYRDRGDSVEELSKKLKLPIDVIQAL